MDYTGRYPGVTISITVELISGISRDGIFMPAFDLILNKLVSLSLA
jgi:hypothetical protein